jgi:hypothetical protein
MTPYSGHSLFFVLVRIVTGAHFFLIIFIFFYWNSIKLKKYLYIRVVNMTKRKTKHNENIIKNTQRLHT